MSVSLDPRHGTSRYERDEQPRGYPFTHVQPLRSTYVRAVQSRTPLQPSVQVPKPIPMQFAHQMLTEKDPARVSGLVRSHFVYADHAQKPLDAQREQAPSTTQVRQGSHTSRSLGSQMINREQPKPALEPRGPMKTAVKQQTFNRDWQQERSRAAAQQEMVRAAAEKARTEQQQDRGRGPNLEQDRGRSR